ncbi:MAG: CheR family methyltransferase [Armatimonadota bacterium]
MGVKLEDIQADLDFAFFKRKVKETYGLDLDAYKRVQMERRLRSIMEKAKARTFQEYFAMLQRNKDLVDEFLDRLTINVSEFFRNPDQFEILRSKILPEILARSGWVKAWSAGCSYGAEAYSLAILLDELAPQKPHSILATDIDDKMLVRAKEGLFGEQEIRNVSRARLLKYFQKTARGYVIREQLKSYIKFQKHDLLSSVFPSSFDLIICRNVVIYFTEEAKSGIYRRFFRSLRPGGYLFVGGTERINDYARIGFEDCGIPFFYKRPLAQ